MREKDLGIWQSWTWAEVLEEVRAFSIGLRRRGVLRGDRVAIIGGNRPRLYWSMSAIQALGAIPVPVCQDSAAEEMGILLGHAGVAAAVAENQEQVDKVLEIRDRQPEIRTIVFDDPRGLNRYKANGLVSFEAVQGEGRAAISADRGTVDAWLAEVAAATGADTGIILYTLGTTGRPKGVMLSHDNVVRIARNANRFDNLDETEEVFAYLPLAWVGDHILSYGQALDAGFCVSCPESRETVNDDRREIGPTFMFAPPRVFEALLSEVMVRMENASLLKRCLFTTFLGLARRVGDDILSGRPVSLSSRAAYALGEILVYGPLRNRLGFSRIKCAYTTGEATGPEIFRFFRSIGVNLKQLYGQTEASVYVTVQSNDDVDEEMVGRPAPETEIRIEPSGEVLYRSPGVFQGYYRDEEATRRTKTADGWVHSGDAGILDRSGKLRIIDRVEHVGRLKDGTLFPPNYIENKLKFFPNIREAVAFGDERDHVAVFINIDMGSVGIWAERNNLAFASYQELAAHPRVYDLIAGHVAKVNTALARAPQLAGARIRRFLVLHKQLDADDGEITRTSKVCRPAVAEHYRDLIEALYDPAVTRRHVATDVAFEDGRKGRIEGDIEIRDVEIAPLVAEREAAE
jgi:long-chain acyl-CoA synthetase